MAFSVDGTDWFLINATPDIRHQLERCEDLRPSAGMRSTPLRGVLLTDAELDHTIGLLSLREGSQLQIWSSASVLQALQTDFPVARILRLYNHASWQRIDPSGTLELSEGIVVKTHLLGNKKPRYVSSAGNSNDWVLGFEVIDKESGKSFLYAPQIGSWSTSLQEVVELSSICFVDGTFWSATELIDLGVSDQSSMDMGHLPLNGENGIASKLKSCSGTRKILVHINNTNPILDRQSAECMLLTKSNIEPGYDGMEFEL